jgi:2-dehydropantoate 2-reductase
VGAGATGGYFGGRLAAAGKDVTFLVRPGRAAQLADRGLRIKGPDGDVTVQPRVVTASAVGGEYDLVVLAVKSYALEQAMIDMAPAVGPRTIVVPLLNGMRHVDELVGAFGPERAWGGVCMIRRPWTPTATWCR